MTVIIMLTLYRVYWVISVWPRSVAALWGFVISPSFILQHFGIRLFSKSNVFYIRFVFYFDSPSRIRLVNRTLLAFLLCERSLLSTRTLAIRSMQ